MLKRNFLGALISVGFTACGGGSIGNPDTIGCLGD